MRKLHSNAQHTKGAERLHCSAMCHSARESHIISSAIFPETRTGKWLHHHTKTISPNILDRYNIYSQLVRLYRHGLIRNWTDVLVYVCVWLSVYACVCRCVYVCVCYVCAKLLISLCPLRANVCSFALACCSPQYKRYFEKQINKTTEHCIVRISKVSLDLVNDNSHSGGSLREFYNNRNWHFSWSSSYVFYANKSTYNVANDSYKLIDFQDFAYMFRNFWNWNSTIGKQRPNIYKCVVLSKLVQLFNSDPNRKRYDKGSVLQIICFQKNGLFWRHFHNCLAWDYQHICFNST